MRINNLIVLLVTLFMASASTGFAFDEIQSKPEEKLIILSGTGLNPRLVEATATYHESTQVLTIEFPVAGFEPYTLSVSSMYNTLDFYVTTPFVSVPINDTNVTIELQLETASGDMYYGSFEATSNTSTE